MSKFKELARLKELEAKATPARWSLTQYSDDILEISREDGTRGFQILFEDSDIDDPQFITDLRNAAPWLLQIAEAFQPGDAEKLKYVPCFRLDGDCDKCSDRMRGACDCVRRLQAACEEMER